MKSHYEMLIELVDAVRDRELINDNCEHLDWANPYEHCDVCMVLNVAKHTTENGFMSQTTPRQRERIGELWERL